jgi:imidazolonepropionase-like amidohydrolase
MGEGTICLAIAQPVAKRGNCLARRNERLDPPGINLFNRSRDRRSRGAAGFLIRSEVMSPLEIIRSATLVGAEVVRQPGRLGEITAGACADLLVVDGDPLKDLGLFQDEGAHIPAIVKGGAFMKNEL